MLICTNKILYITQKCLLCYFISQILSPSILIEKSWLVTSRKDKIDVPISFKAKNLKLQKMVIPDNHGYFLSSFIFNDKDKLLITREIRKYWTEKIQYIHGLAKPSTISNSK